MKRAVKNALEPEKTYFENFFSFLATRITSAHWWIENRDEYAGFFRDYYDDIVDESKFPSAEEMMYPEEQKTKTLAEILFVIDVRKRILVKSDKDDIIIKTVKKLNYEWDYDERAWVLYLNETTGSKEDRMAEVANALLQAGVPVRIENQEAKQRAIKGDFCPAHYRWIRGNGKDSVKFTWRRDEDLYNKVRQLPYAKWKDGGIVVSVKYFEEILGFAEVNDFEIADSASKILYAAEEHSHKVERVQPAKVEKSKKKNIADILESSRDVLEDLKDK